MSHVSRPARHGTPRRAATPRRTGPHSKRGGRRRGFSLIETLIVISISSLLTAAVGACLLTLYRAEHRTREAIGRREALTELSLHLREDAHAARRAELDAPQRSLKLDAGEGRTITYRAAPGQVERQISRGAETLHRDAYRLPGLTVAWDVQQAAGQRQLAVAVLAPQTEPGQTANQGPAERLEAVVGTGPEERR